MISGGGRAGWTDERVEQAKKLFHEGLSFAQIAAEIGGGLSRNAVIGKLHRLGLKGSKQVSAAPKMHKRTMRRGGPRLRLVAEEAAPTDKRKPPTVVKLPVDPAVTMCATRVSLLDARQDQCRWPASDDGSASMVCGAKTWADGKPWCAQHARRSIQPYERKTAAA